MKRFCVGVIGCGWIFSLHAYPLHRLEQTEVVAVCDDEPQQM